jgi:hypothetical protein
MASVASRIREDGTSARRTAELIRRAKPAKLAAAARRRIRVIVGKRDMNETAGRTTPWP